MSARKTPILLRPAPLSGEIMSDRVYPYKPPWYPNQTPEHNPWMASELFGITYYEAWVKSLPDGRLAELIAEHRDRVAAENGEAF